MATNKVATVALLDIGSSVSREYESETFFKKCQWCLLRIIQRTIFSGENDELAIVLVGSEQTNNNLALTAEDGMYSNIYEYISLQKPNWDVYEKVQNLTTTKITSNWVEGLVVSLDYLKEQVKGKRFKDKQIFVLSDFAMDLEFYKEKMNFLADSINSDNLKLVVIGVDLDEECRDKVMDSQLGGSLGLMFTLLENVEHGVSLSFVEAEADIVYYEKKKKTGRFTKVNLSIGSKINIPIRWIKLNLEPTRIKWVKKPHSTANTELGKVNTSTFSNAEKTDEQEIRYIMETQKMTKFGNSEVVLSYADLEAMKRQTGPASCNLIGCVRSHRIKREMFIGKDLYLVVAEKSPRAQGMFASFIDALIESDKFALVRRISTKNGKVKIGVLIPVSDEVGKLMYFLQLPFAEHSMVVPHVLLPEPNNTEILTTFDKLIDAMTIEDKPKELPMKDPTFQLRCHLLHLYQSGQLQEDSKIPELPEFIMKLCNPYPELLERALPHLEELEKMLPINIDDDQLETSQSIDVTPDDGCVVYEMKSDIMTKEKDVLGNMDWETAETQEWPEDLKNKYNIERDSVPELPIVLKEGKLLKNKYELNYISDRVWEEHGAKRSSKTSSDLAYINNPEIQEMLNQRQNTDVDVDTNDMLQRIRTRENL